MTDDELHMVADIRNALNLLYHNPKSISRETIKEVRDHADKLFRKGLEADD